jgi:hypothetical protein
MGRYAYVLTSCRCIGNNEYECPICAEENAMIKDLRTAQQEYKLYPEQFFAKVHKVQCYFNISLTQGKVDEAEDGFQTIADYFAHDMFTSISQLKS